jgi:hypothetical protein
MDGDGFAIGFRPQAPVAAEIFADPAVREEWIQEKHMRAFSLVDSANPMRAVDLLLKPEVPFEELLARSQEALVGDTPVRVVSLADLITLSENKRVGSYSVVSNSGSAVENSSITNAFAG